MAHYVSQRFLLALVDGGSGSGSASAEAGDEGNKYWFQGLSYEIYYPIIFGLLLLVICFLVCTIVGCTCCCTMCYRYRSRKGVVDIRQLEESGIIGRDFRERGESATMSPNQALVNGYRADQPEGGEGVGGSLEMTPLSDEQQEAIERRESTPLDQSLQGRIAATEGEGGTDTALQVEQQTSVNGHIPNQGAVEEAMVNGHIPNQGGVEEGTQTDNPQATGPQQARPTHESNTNADTDPDGGGKGEKVECTAEVHISASDNSGREGATNDSEVNKAPPVPLNHSHAPNGNAEHKIPTTHFDSLPSAYICHGLISFPPKASTMVRPTKVASAADIAAQPGNHTPPSQATTSHDADLTGKPQLRHLSKKKETTPGRRFSADQQPSLQNGSQGSTSQGAPRPYSQGSRLSADLPASFPNSWEQETASNSHSSLVGQGHVYTEARGRSKTQEHTEQSDV